VCDRFGVRSWELCTLGCHASDDGCFSTSWIVLQPIINQNSPAPLGATPIPSSSQPAGAPVSGGAVSSGITGLGGHNGSTVGPAPVEPPTKPAVRIPTVVA
jgi:hypothetical protein